MIKKASQTALPRSQPTIEKDDAALASHGRSPRIFQALLTLTIEADKALENDPRRIHCQSRESRRETSTPSRSDVVRSSRQIPVMAA
jgi:hypothetical protein